MTIDWARLAEPFPDEEIKQRPGRGSMTFSYVDARAVMQRLDDVLTPAGWEFTSSVIPGSDVVHGRLVIDGIVREDYGYPNSDRDEEPIKAASSDALKRCAVMFGVGRHLYEDNASSGSRPARPPAPRPVAPAAPRSVTPAPKKLPPHTELYDGTWSQSVTYDVPEEPGYLRDIPGEEFAPIGSKESAVPVDQCPIHRVPWAGGPGDYWHKDPDGKYCRHPDNVKRAARRAS